MAVAVLTILIVLLVPMMTRFRSMADSVACVSNLRQIGSGILAYAQDNDGRLPGPLLSGQYPFSDVLPAYGRYSQLAHVLTDYLEGQRVEAESARGTVFLCPAFRRTVPDYQYSVSYGVNIQQRLDGTQELRPVFGYANNLDPATFQTMANLPPLRLADLSRLTDEFGNPAASSTWIVRDADTLDERFKGLKASTDMVRPAKPVHGRWRNALFADFHVARMEAP